MKRTIDCYFSSNYRKLLFYAKKIIITHNEEDAKNIIAESYISCINFLHKFNNLESRKIEILSYIYGVIKMNCRRLNYKNKIEKNKTVFIIDMQLKNTLSEFVYNENDKELVMSQIKIEHELDKAMKFKDLLLQDGVNESEALYQTLHRIRLDDKIEKNKYKQGLFVNKLNNKKLFKVIYKNEIIWIKIDSKTNEKMFGTVQTIGVHYLKKIEVSKNDIIEI